MFVQPQTAWWALALFIVSGASCAVDERALVLRGSGGSAAGSLGSAGSNSGGEAGDASSAAGSGGDSAGDAGAPPAGGSTSGSGSAGAPSSAGGSVAASGSTSGGSAGSDPTRGGGAGTAGSGTAGSGTAGGTNAGGNSASGGGAGISGNFPCGDTDHDLVDDCVASGAVNPGFDLDTSHWSAGQWVQTVWDARDGNGKAGSGSLLISNVAPTDSASGSIMAGAEQCIAVTGDLQYALNARVFMPSGQGTGLAGINLLIFGNDGCTGTFLSSVTSSATEATDAWTTLESKLKMPNAARSLVLRLVTIRPFAQTKLSALFDNVLVKQMP